MKSLFSKLSMAMVAIVVLSGAAFFAVDRIYKRAYYEELTQKLNAPIAMYVTDQRQLIADGNPDLDSLRELADHAMVINPTAEIYLLDKDGNILGHSLPEESVVMAAVDLAPIRELLGGEPRLPLRGDDPRNTTAAKVFSAAEIATEQGLQGYLYVVLGGRTYEELADDIGNSYVARAGMSAAATIIVIACLFGLLVFRMLTKRLKVLDRDMQRVTASHFQDEPKISRQDDVGDEIDALSNAFVDMSAQIRTQIDQLKENDRLRRELVSNISHDLRTPLSAMQGYIETLIVKGESMSDDERDRFLRIARKHTIRLGTLIGDLFELSKLDSASVTPSLEAFSLPELVQDIAQEFQIEAEQKEIRIEIESNADASSTVADIGLIQRVLENLVRNAIQFTPAGGVVTISVNERDDQLAVAVSDNGPGIAESDVPRIFDRFYRAVDGEEAQSDSSGLGLAIVKRILELHDSRITVISKPNAGTRFEFELPVCDVAA